MMNEHDEQVVSDNIPSNEMNSEVIQQLETCQIELASWKERAMRLTADFDNFKRRAEKQQASWLESSQMKIFAELIGVVDDFDRALAQMASPDYQALRQGVELTYQNFLKMLASFGVEPMKDEVDFDPERHEAVMQVDSSDHNSGQIVEVFQRGYLFRDRVLRAAKVSVAS